MKFGVNKKVLLYTAGCVWIFAGINILRIGIVTWLNDTHYWLFKLDYHDLHDRFRDHDPHVPFTAEFFHFRILYGIIHGVDHNGILILETRKNRWELRIEN